MNKDKELHYMSEELDYMYDEIFCNDDDVNDEENEAFDNFDN